jgi:hypothetical protein
VYFRPGNGQFTISRDPDLLRCCGTSVKAAQDWVRGGFAYLRAEMSEKIPPINMMIPTEPKKSKVFLDYSKSQEGETK